MKIRKAIKSVTALAMVMALSAGSLMMLGGTAHAENEKVTLEWVDGGTIAPSSGKFRVIGPGVPANAVGICSDPELPAPIGSLNWEGYSTVIPNHFYPWSLTAYARNHPVIGKYPEGDWRDDGRASIQLRVSVLSSIVMSLIPTLPKEYEDFIWADVWQKFQDEGLAAKHNTDYQKFKFSFAHAALGYLANQHQNGYDHFPPDVKKFFQENIEKLEPGTGRVLVNWVGSKTYTVFRDKLSPEQQDALMNDVIRVGNIDDNTKQAIFFQYKPFEFNVKLNMDKVSSNPNFTSGNSAYNIEGAVYGVFKDQGTTNKVGELRIDANGSSNTISVPPSTYYIKELTSPPSYELDPTVYTIAVK